MLGSDVTHEFRSRGHIVVAPSHAELDISDPSSVANLAGNEFGAFDWCINCAAYTAVDKSEAEPDAAMRINGIAPGYLASMSQMRNAKFLHVSTDFVFDGTKATPYEPEDPTQPLGEYGRSKLAGEEAARAGNMQTIILRTAWLYGPNGQSFPRTLIRAWLAGKDLRVVADQVGSPTYTGDLARVIVDIAERDLLPGVYHAAGRDVMSWRDFAHLAIDTYRLEVVKREDAVHVQPIRTSDWPTPAARPAYSALSFEKLAREGVLPMRAIQDALKDFVRRLPQPV